MVHYSNLPDDILRYLCQTMRMERLYGLMNLSGVDRRTREIALSSIFDQISLPRRLSENQESWVGLEETINVILSNQAIVSSVRTLDVYVYGYSKSEGKLPGTIFTLLFSFPKISTLSIRMGNKYCSQTQEELGDQSNSDTSMSLFPSSLNSLIIPNRKWIFLTEYVLQLESLVIESIAHGGPDPHFSDDIQRLGVKHPGLKKLYCQDACFTRNVLGECLKPPLVSYLTLFRDRSFFP
ncbi:hypothetical protein FRC14_007797 [Serendipita sp. 396]|nr:hypothetical protein FRC14_007797 [Serendipita sp. 396]